MRSLLKILFRDVEDSSSIKKESQLCLYDPDASRLLKSGKKPSRSVSGTRFAQNWELKTKVLGGLCRGNWTL